MKIAIIHYHLNRGGVTQVIANHLSALAAAESTSVEEVAILYGGRREGWSWSASTAPFDVSLSPLEGLDYDDQPAHADRLANEIARTLEQLGFAPAETVLHVHNHSLGKNMALPAALTRLADDGYALLLQIHDFAEDFRPDNYRSLVDALCPQEPSQLAGQLYPQAAQIHYATLNGRDFTILEVAGVPSERLHRLPNPVSEPASLASRDAARAKLARQTDIQPADPLLVYPVRGIRRKNLGEALLWSVLAGGSARVALTLPPLNPVEQGSYGRWKDFSQTHGLPCLFEFGAHSELTFPEVQAAADRLLTTSVAEGFGMVFLESWLIERPLTGRDLPEITADFVEAGVRLSACESQLEVPLEWVGEGEYRRQLIEAYEVVVERYGRPPRPLAERERSLDPATADGWVDFATLTSPLQRATIERLIQSATAADQILARNPHIMRGLNWQEHFLGDLPHNANAVRESFSLGVSGERLDRIYDRTVASPRETPAPSNSTETILEGFLDICRFHPIRVEP